MDKLIKKYKGSLKIVRILQLRASGEDRKHLNSMASDLQYAIDWMQTARQPGNRRGIDRRAAYQREIPMDPNSIPKYEAFMQRDYCQTVTKSDVERIQDALSVLTEREREVYLMAKVDCFSYAQIALILRLAKATIQETIERAEKKVKKRVGTSNLAESEKARISTHTIAT